MVGGVSADFMAVSGCWAMVGDTSADCVAVRGWGVVVGGLADAKCAPNSVGFCSSKCKILVLEVFGKAAE